MKRRRLFGLGGALAALAVTPGCGGSLGRDNVDPALRGLTLANPLALLPVIVEMQPAAPAVPAGNVARALAALDLLRVYGVPVAALPLINAAAGFANGAAIDAISVLPGVAFVHPDSVHGVLSEVISAG